MSDSAELSSPVVSSAENPEPLCSICLEEVSAACGRTMVTLQCSYIFHLDCIGSAFNAAGIMQCPNCRQIEKGEWFCYENRDSETDMEQIFNQDVEGQEPEMVFVNSVFYPVPVIYSSYLIGYGCFRKIMKTTGSYIMADHGIAQVPVPHFFDGSVPVPNQNQGGHLTIGPVLQNEIIDLNYQIAVPDAAFGAPQVDDHGSLPNVPFLLQHRNRYIDIGNFIPGGHVPAPETGGFFRLVPHPAHTHNGQALNLPVHYDALPMTNYILVPQVAEQDYLQYMDDGSLQLG
ncbi:hypothetical protein LWI29_011319 [Acer saccharum]|uniref:RING-type domain-containing protein n=1 Tax=Acer saccharum TaxID=4024 RepID=A0AA39TEG8_ACESA|nr:hypothetical protein LWI29_011319 [Acer saccharum]